MHVAAHYFTNHQAQTATGKFSARPGGAHIVCSELADVQLKQTTKPPISTCATEQRHATSIITTDGLLLLATLMHHRTLFFAGFLQGLASACEQLAALLTQQQQQQQQQRSISCPVLERLLSPATAFSLLFAWRAVADYAPKNARGDCKVLMLAEMLATVAPACKLAAAAVLKSAQAAAAEAAAAGALGHGTAGAAGSCSSRGGRSRGGRSTGSSSSSSSRSSSRKVADSSGSAWQLALTDADLLRMVMAMAQFVRCCISSESMARIKETSLDRLEG
jgi:hypothetical protein